jgi:AcrR family transcriptional regulator
VRARQEHRERLERHPARRRRTLEQSEIVTVAIAIADRDGFEAVSMRRVARELGVGAMTLYHHVADKDELVLLMADAISAEMLVPDPMPEGWRAALRAIEHRTRDTFIRHPWLIHTVDQVSKPTLNSLRHVEQSARAVAELEAEGDLGVRLLFAADDYTFGYVLRETTMAGLGPHADEPFAVPAWLQEAIASGEFPTVSQWMAAGGTVELPADRFEVGLEALFDGFEALRARSRR